MKLIKKSMQNTEALLYPSIKDSQEIKQYIQTRQISYLVHFTRLENLDTILKHGLLGRMQLEDYQIQYAYNDSGRYDQIREAICLSISFPNYKMFYKYRMESKQTDWVVIFIKPEILWEKKCLFCYTNAASNEMSYLSKESRMGIDALQKMFDNPALRDKLNLPPHYTTDPQAEILVLENIEREYILKVLLHEEHSRKNQMLLYHIFRQYLQEGLFFRDSTNPSYFSWRQDFSYWKKRY